MAITYKFISSYTTPNNTTNTITLSSIPQTYTDLVLRMCVRRNVNGSYYNILLSFNGSPTYYNIFAQGNGSGGPGASNVPQMVGDAQSNNETAGYFDNIEVYLPNYRDTNMVRTFTSNSAANTNTSLGYVMLTGNSISTTTAINTINIINRDGGNFLADSTVYLYGVNNS